MTLTIELPENVVAALAAVGRKLGGLSPSETAALALCSLCAEADLNVVARLVVRGPGEPRIADDAYWAEFDAIIDGTAAP